MASNVCTEISKPLNWLYCIHTMPRHGTVEMEMHICHFVIEIWLIFRNIQHDVLPIVIVKYSKYYNYLLIKSCRVTMIILTGFITLHCYLNINRIREIKSKLNPVKPRVMTDRTVEAQQPAVYCSFIGLLELILNIREKYGTLQISICTLLTFHHFDAISRVPIFHFTEWWTRQIVSPCYE